MKRLIFSLSAFLIFIGSIAAKPAKKELIITQAGAVGDSITLNTQIIQQSIDKIHAEGGGILVVPKGIFLTGAIYLKQGVDLRIDKEGVLKGSVDRADYPPIDRRIEGHIEPKFCPALINAYNIDGLKIYGEGTIRGGGQPFWTEFWTRLAADKTTKNLDVYRPQNIFIQDCKNVEISGLKLRGSGFWNLHMYRCRWVKIENLDIRTPLRAPSTDGIDVDSSQDIFITGCYISVDDDCIAMKGNKGIDAMKDKSSPPVERVTVTNCTFDLGYGVLTLGSEATVVKDIRVKNCTLKGNQVNTLLRVKVRTDTPQHYENISIENITVDGRYTLMHLAGWSQYKNTQGQPDPHHLVKNITLKNIKGTMATFADINPPVNTVVEGITFKNIDVKSLSAQYKARVLKTDKLVVKSCFVNGQPVDLKTE